MADPTNPKTACPLCQNQEAFLKNLDPPLIVCERCGEFRINIVAQREIGADGEVHPYLSAATRKASEAGTPIFLQMKNWQEYEAEQRSIRVSEKLDNLLRLIGDRTGAPGRGWGMKPASDYPLIAASDEAELQAYLTYLVHRGLVLMNPTGWGLTIPGWEVVQPLPRPGGIPK